MLAGLVHPTGKVTVGKDAEEFTKNALRSLIKQGEGGVTFAFEEAYLCFGHHRESFACDTVCLFPLERALGKESFSKRGEKKMSSEEGRGFIAMRKHPAQSILSHQS